MDQNRFTYYRVKYNGMIAKGDGLDYWIYDEGKWIKDEESMISDMINGYDPYEPPGSPFAFGSTSVMDDIEEIPYEKSMDLIAKKTIKKLIRKWKKEYKEEKEKWDLNPLRQAKDVRISFTMNDSGYTLYPENLGFGKTAEDGGFMESILYQLVKDLEEAGASDISAFSSLD